MRYTVREVGNAREFRLFYQFQNRLYRDCPTYVPSLDYDQRHTLAHSPCLDYCQQQLLLCFSIIELHKRKKIMTIIIMAVIIFAKIQIIYECTNKMQEKLQNAFQF